MTQSVAAGPRAWKLLARLDFEDDFGRIPVKIAAYTRPFLHAEWFCRRLGVPVFRIGLGAIPSGAGPGISVVSIATRTTGVIG